MGSAGIEIVSGSGSSSRAIGSTDVRGVLPGTWRWLPVIERGQKQDRNRGGGRRRAEENGRSPLSRIPADELSLELDAKRVNDTAERGIPLHEGRDADHGRVVVVLRDCVVIRVVDRPSDDRERVA